MEPSATKLLLSRSFSAGRFIFAVAATDERLVDLVETVFRDLDEPMDAEGATASFTLRASSDGAGEARYDITGPVIGSMRGVALPFAIATLVAAVTRAALDHECDRLHLHAAGAVRNGRVAVLAAPRETGKTTTLARLVIRGWSYMSDEMLSIGRDDDDVRGFAKPLSIKPGGRAFVPELSDHLLPQEGVTTESVLVAALGGIGARIRSSGRPHLIALLNRAESGGGRPVDARRIHPVDAVVGLMKETLDAGRHGPGSVTELARLAVRCHCYEIAVGEPDETAEMIEQLFDQPAVDPLHMVDHGASGRVSPSVRTVFVGDRAVVHQEPDGHILALDPAGTQVWTALAGAATRQPVELAAPVIAPFVRQLAGLALIDVT